MFSNVLPVRIGILHRTLTSKTGNINAFWLEKSLKTNAGTKLNMELHSDQQRKNLQDCSKNHGDVLEDEAVLCVGKTIKSCHSDSKEIKLRYKKESYFRKSLPYSLAVLENSYSLTVSQKRRIHTSNSSYRSSPQWNQKDLYEEENINTNENVHLDPNYATNRHWELTQLGVQHLHTPVPGFEFFIMSYNILAQNLLQDNMYLYRESQENVLDWSYRSEKLLLEIRCLKADILCLQEVNQTHYKDFLEPELGKLGFKGVYVKRTGDKLDGCATFYNTKKFYLEDCMQVPYYKSNYCLLDRDNVGLVVKLKPRKHPCSEEDSICVANTHILFNPRRGDIKLAQIMCLLAEVNRMSQTRHSRCQIVVCGDFNATPFSDLYKFLVQGYLRYEGLLTRTISGQKEGMYGRDKYLPKDFFPAELNISDQCQYITPQAYQLSMQNRRLGHHTCPEISQSSGCMWHHLNLVSTYRHTIERLGHREKEVTTQHSNDSCTVDYILYGVVDRNVHTRRNKHRTSSVHEGKLKLLGRWGLMSSKEIKELGNLPNHIHPSDHLPLLVKMILV